MNYPVAARGIVAIALVAAGIAGWILLREDGALAHWSNPGTLRESVRGLGALGPFAIIALMTAVILVSPLPSAPIALAAGAVYGHGWGTLYVALGSEIGAVTAFLLARYLGFEFVHRHFGTTLSRGLAGSQNMLMGTVFVSRLLPFVSFDLVSYAAGLTVLSFWRFAIATLAGILPASFLLAHFGSRLTADDPYSGWIVVVVLGVLGVTPLFARALRRKAQ